MIQTMLIIDDFFANPLEVREQALKLTYPPTHDDDQYGGRTSLETTLPPDSDEGFSQILREPVRGKTNLAHGRCRISSLQDSRRDRRDIQGKEAMTDVSHTTGNH